MPDIQRPDGDLRERFAARLHRCLTGGEQAEAEQVVREALVAGFSAPDVHDLVLAAAMAQIGDDWESGRIGIASEHRATEIAFGLLSILRGYERAAERTRRREIVLATAVEGERHVLGLRMAADVLDAAGFSVHYLGADLPLDALASALRDFRPSAVALTATIDAAGPRVRETVGLIRAVDPRIAVLAGGAAVPEEIEEFGAARLNDVAGVAERTDALLRRPDLN